MTSVVNARDVTNKNVVLGGRFSGKKFLHLVDNRVVIFRSFMTVRVLISLKIFTVAKKHNEILMNMFFSVPLALYYVSVIPDQVVC